MLDNLDPVSLEEPVTCMIFCCHASVPRFTVYFDHAPPSLMTDKEVRLTSDANLSLIQPASAKGKEEYPGSVKGFGDLHLCCGPESKVVP